MIAAMQAAIPALSGRTRWWAARLAPALAGAIMFCVAAGGPTPAAAAGAKHHFTVAAIEPKGGANTADESFPSANRVSGEGFEIKAPDANGRWEVSAYVWMPAQIIVTEGDDVTIDFVGINGHAHSVSIKGYAEPFALARGTTRRVHFVADKAGVFPIDCMTHHDSMRGEIVVLPAR